MCWLLLDIDLSLKVKHEKVAKVAGVVNQVSCRRGIWFYAWKRQVCLRPFFCPNFVEIDYISNMKLHLVPYGTFGSERVKVVCRGGHSSFCRLTRSLFFIHVQWISLDTQSMRETGVPIVSLFLGTTFPWKRWLFYHQGQVCLVLARPYFQTTTSVK